MNTDRILGMVVSLLVGVAAPARAAEIALFQSAIDTIVRRDVYGPDGKRTLSGNSKGCTYAIVEQPTTTLSGGRLRLRTHFSGRAAVKVGDRCVGTGEAFWLTVSGVPAVEGDVLKLTEVRLDEGKELYRLLIEQLVKEAVAPAVQVNLRSELQKVLGGAGSSYKATLPMLTVSSIVTSDEAITIQFDFRLEAR